MDELTKGEEDYLLEEGLDLWRDLKIPMFYKCPDYSPAQYGEKLTSDEVEREIEQSEYYDKKGYCDK